MNAAAIKLAHKRLETLQAAESVSASGTAAPAPSTSTRFGTGFFVSADREILTNNHVVAGCKSLATGDGRVLAVLSRNESSDLALLQSDRSQNDMYKGFEQNLIEMLRRFNIDDDTRQSVWLLFHAQGASKSDFVAALDKLS